MELLIAMVKEIHQGKGKLQYKTNTHCLLLTPKTIVPPLITGGCVRMGIQCNNCAPSYNMKMLRWRKIIASPTLLKGKMWPLNENDGYIAQRYIYIGLILLMMILGSSLLTGMLTRRCPRQNE